MSSMWLVVIAVGVVLALLSAPVLGRRRLGGKAHRIRQRTPATPEATMKRSPNERPSSPPRARRPAPPVTEFVVVGRRVQVTVNGNGLLVRSLQGSSWYKYVELEWEQIHKAYLDTDRFDAALALYATTSNGEDSSKRHLVDAQQLTRGQWNQLRSAVYEWSEGAVVIDLSPLDDPPFNTNT
ncbi:hypothetical protein ACSHWB_40550 [Lentzea sp. HUAS TT2]|uniref:hypothetical protein n=1 Tax=Lentzea sp. HUAS TT2 TaxID=3447454 RepID=UPI003F72CBDC